MNAPSFDAQKYDYGGKVKRRYNPNSRNEVKFNKINTLETKNLDEG